MLHKEMMEMITKLRANKRHLLAELEINEFLLPELKQKIKAWAKRIPARNSNIPWMAGIQFQAAYDEIREEYIYLVGQIDKAVNDYFAAKRVAEHVKAVTAANPNQEVEQPKRGGKRAGAGRKSKGVKKVVSIVLPQEVWDDIDNQIQNDADIGSYSQYFRVLVTGEL